MKKLTKLFSLIACFCTICFFSACEDFFEPLPEDFLDRIYTESVETPEESTESTEPPASSETEQPDSSTSEEVPVDPELPDSSSGTETPDEPTEPEQPEVPNEPVEPSEPTEPVEPEEPTEPNEPVVPQETVSDPLSFTEGEHTVENLRIEATAENADAIYANGEGTVVTIESGYYDGGDNGSTTAVYARDGAKVVINGGTFKAGAGCATIYAKNNSTVEINGGYFEADDVFNGNYFVLNLADNTNSSIVVKGGTFVNFNPADNASENPAVNFVANGYEVVSETQENGDIWYTVQEIEIVAE